MSVGVPPRVAVIGAGYWGKNLIRNFQQIGALSAIVDESAETRGQFAEQYPGVAVHAAPEALWSDASIEGVVIATPAETHGGLVRAALEAGKDVFVEKPLCLSKAEGAELIALADRNQRILMVGHLLWYHPAVLKLKDLIDAGELGRLQYIYSNRLNLGKIRREENILWSFAPHDISVILGLLGESPKHVEVMGGNYLHPNIADVTMSMLTFASGVRAHIFVSWLHPFKEQKLVVVGDRKMAVFDDTSPSDKLVLYPHSIEWRNQIPVAQKAAAESVPLPAVEPLRAECEHFLDRIRDRARPRTDGREALRVLAVLEECQISLDRAPSAAQPAPAAAAAHETAAARKYVVHETACIDADVEIGEGTKVWHFSHILPGTRIGTNCSFGQNVVVGPDVKIGNGVKVQNNVSIYKGVELEDDVFCGPSMVFTNVYNPRSAIRRMDELRPTLVKRGASIGANSTIVCGNTIGRNSFVGAGAVVIRDVPDHALVVGNPARVVGWMCSCGVRLSAVDSSATCDACGKSYVRGENGLSETHREAATVAQ